MTERRTTNFEAVAIRYVDTGTDEFLNMGLVLISPDARRAGARWTRSLTRITRAFPSAEVALLRRLQRAVDEAVELWNAHEPPSPTKTVLQLVEQAFHLDDAAVQTSPVISGITSDAERSLNELFQIYVEKNDRPSHRSARDS